MNRLKTTRAQLTVTDVVLLSIRILVWVMMISYGLPKLVGGPERREALWSSMAFLGISEWFVVWWFLAMFAEFFGWLMLILGAFTRFGAAMISFTFVIVLIVQGQRLGADPERIFELTKFLEILFYLYASTFFLIKGAGKMSLDRRFGLCLIDTYTKSCTK